jgi:2-methylcitrate dehydratase PrpD
MRALTRRELLSMLAASPVARSQNGLTGGDASIGLPLLMKQNGTTQAAPPTLALRFARSLNTFTFGNLPPLAVEHAKMIIASTIASAASGSLIGSARIVRDLAKERGGRAEATVWFDGTKLPLGDTARVNAMLSDAAASDDSDLRNVAHTGTNVTATGLAVAERTDATGQDLLGAIVAGYEAAGRIGEALGADRQGFHASVIVAFGGVVTAARLLRMTDDQLAHAISLIATSMGGLAIGTNSWAREYHAGNAALAAVNAVQAAGRGYTANEDMLEAGRGFLAVFSGEKGDAGALTRDLGKKWDIITYLAIKLVPGAHAFHPSVEAAVNAARQSGVPPDQVARILVSGAQSRTIASRQRPKDMVEAIHSLPYFIASAVADKNFSWIHATDEKIRNPEVARLMDLIEPDPAPPSVHYEWSWGGTVTIVTKSGGRYSSTVDAPRGSGPRGIDWSDIDAKYRALMPESSLPAKRVEESLALIHRFHELKHVSDFTHLIGRV